MWIWALLPLLARNEEEYNMNIYIPRLRKIDPPSLYVLLLKMLLTLSRAQSHPPAHRLPPGLYAPGLLSTFAT
jgi:hypothetical protein